MRHFLGKCDMAHQMSHLTPCHASHWRNLNAPKFRDAHGASDTFSRDVKESGDVSERRDARRWSVWKRRFYGAFLRFFTREQMNNEREEGEDEDDVDESSGDVETEADGPADEKDDGDSDKHGMMGFSHESGRRWSMGVIFGVRWMGGFWKGETEARKSTDGGRSIGPSLRPTALIWCSERVPELGVASLAPAAA